MFFKLLPTLTKTKFDQAKIVFKSDQQQMRMPIELPNLFTDDIKQEPAYDVNAPFINIQDTYDNTAELSHDTQTSDLQHDECVEIRIEDGAGTSVENVAEEVIQYLQLLQEQGLDSKNVKVIYVQSGQIVGVTDETSKEESDSNIDETKEQVSSYECENKEQERDSHKDSNCTQYENVVESATVL